MAISVPRNPDRPPSGQAGLTLVEVLVVLALIGIATAAAMLSVGGPNPGRDVAAEARQLAQRLQAAADEAVVTAHPIDFAWDAGHYSFAAVGEAPANEQHAMPDGIALTSTARSPARIVGDGIGPTLDVTLSRDGHTRTVRFDGLNAELTPSSL